MKYIIAITLLLSGCSSYVTKAEYQETLKKIDQNFAYQGQMIQASNERVFAAELKKGRDAKCPNGFDIRTGICIEDKK